MVVKAELLKQTRYFRDFSEAEIAGILGFFEEVHYAKGVHFLIEGEGSDRLFFVISGLVKVYKTSSAGKEQVLHIAPPGDSLNDVSLYDGGPNAASMVTLSPVTMYTILKQDVLGLLQQRPQLMMSVIRSLAERIRRDANLVESLSSSQVLGRLAKLFLGRYGGEEYSTGLPLTQKDIAGLIGSSREMVNRSLRVLEEMGGIRLSRRKIIVLDRDVLQKVIQGSLE